MIIIEYIILIEHLFGKEVNCIMGISGFIANGWCKRNGERKEVNALYNPLMDIREKYILLDAVLPDDCMILTRNGEEIYVLETTTMSFYGDETEYPLELFVNKIITKDMSSW